MSQSYSEKLKSPLWQKKRLTIFRRDKWKCRLCSAKDETLHIHHLKYLNKDPWSIQDKYLITVCDTCHKKLHKKPHIPTIKELEELSKYEFEDGVVDRIIKQPIHEVKQSLKAAEYCR